MLQRILLTVSISIFCAISTFADDRAEIAKIKSFPPASETTKSVFATSFDTKEDAAKKLPAGFKIAPGEGCNGTAALFYERTDPKAYPLYSVPMKGLQPGKGYTISMQIRGENIKATGNEKNPGAICVEYSQNGKWIAGGGYYSTRNLGSDWQKIEMMFIAKPEVATGMQADLKFYLRKGVTGKIWFDDVDVRESTIPPTVLLTRPDRLSFFGGDGKFSLRLEDSIPKNTKILATVSNAGKTTELLLTPSGLDVQANAGILQNGPVEIVAKIADMDEKKILAEEKFRLEARPEAEPPKNACTIDEFGRAIVDGKPFMPLGVFGFADEKNYIRLKDAGFNCLQLYNSLGLRGNTDHKDPIKNVQEGLDLIDKHGLKILFSLKDQFPHHSARKSWGGAEGIDAVSELAVKTVKDHPALLAWYVSDEETRKDVPLVLGLRELISRIDPWHPTWTLTYRYDDLPYYGISGDVIGVDPYPISEKEIEQSIKLVKTAILAGRSTGLPVWSVPQIFNWGVYRLKEDKEAFAKSHFPTLIEMRSMSLASAMYGAKGFVYYSNFDIIQRAEKLLPGSGEREWAKVVEMVKTVKELEPFIMSTKKPLEIAVESEPAGAVEAGALLDDSGNFRVIVIGTGGKAKGRFTLPESLLKLKKEPLRSKFGNVKSLGNDVYEFSADAVDSDVLE